MTYCSCDLFCLCHPAEACPWHTALTGVPRPHVWHWAVRSMDLLQNRFWFLREMLPLCSLTFLAWLTPLQNSIKQWYSCDTSFGTGAGRAQGWRPSPLCPRFQFCLTHRHIFVCSGRVQTSLTQLYKWSANYIIFKKSWMFNLFSCCSQIGTATFTYFFIFPFFNFFFPSRHHKELTSSGLYSRWRTEFLQQGWTTLSRLNAAECCFWASSPNCNDFVTLTLVLWTNKTRANHMCLIYCLYVIFQNSTGRCTWN